MKSDSGLTARLLRLQPGRLRIIKLLTLTLCIVSTIVVVNRSKILLPLWLTNELGTITETDHQEREIYQAATGRQEVRGHYYLNSPALLLENGRLRLWRPYPSHRTGVHWINSPAVLLENGQLLPGPANAPLEDIAAQGEGRYAIRPGKAIFSTSDGTSPVTNGRHYTISYPYIVGTPAAFLLYLLTLALLLIVSASQARKLQSLLEFHPLFMSLTMLLVVFIFTRGPFYLFYPLVGLAPDTSSYLEPINQALRGELPSVSIRPPGYPLFIYLTTLIQDRWLTVIFAQSFLSLLAGILLIVAIHRGYRTLTIPAAIAISGFLGNSRFIYYETSALSESLYTSFLILTFAMLVAGLHGRRSFQFLLASLCGGLAILIKPAGIYLLVIFIIVTLFLIINRYPWRMAIANLVPFVVIVGSLAVYNRLTVGELVVSTFGECQLGAATAHFWQPDPEFPQSVNEKIRNELPASLEKSGLDAAALATISTTWNPRRLGELFEPYYDKIIYEEGWTLGSRFGLSYEEARPLIRKISLRSISRYPSHYVKFVWSSFSTYYLILQWKLDLYHFLHQRADEFFDKKERSYSGEVAKEYRSVSSSDSALSKWIESGPGSAQTSLKVTLWQRLHLVWEGVNNELFNNVLWILIALPVFILGIVRLIQSRLSDVGAFVLVVAFLSILGSSLVVSLIQLGIERYSYPNHFLIYLAPALLPSIWRSSRSRP
ncbi:MAG: hypothetical protein ACKOB4_00055 [Acidobacteriota bacterium]